MRWGIFINFLFIFVMMGTTAYAWMWQMEEQELSEVTAEGFSNFDILGDVTRASFDIKVSTFTEIESLKMGYYNDGISNGWDQNWVNVSLGSPTQDLVCDGLYLEVTYSNVADPANRTINSIKVGTPSMTGPISANFISFSGHIENPAQGVLVDGRRLNLGQRTITSSNSEFSASLNQIGAQKGWWVHWNNATINP